jgi:uncharacterized protein (TIGR02594 family)
MTAIPSWYALARNEIGLREIEGSKANPRILDYFRLTGAGWVADDAVPWCAAFANAMLAQAGIDGTRSLAARSFLKWGRKVAKPYRGCIVVFSRGAAPWQGHVGFVEKVSDASVWCLGGNQGDGVNIRRYARSRVLGFREPKSASRHFTVLPADEVRTDVPVWLMPGSQGPKVLEAQRALAGKGFRPGLEDGVFGPRTARAVVAFKRKSGLSARPVIGPVTWEKLIGPPPAVS